MNENCLESLKMDVELNGDHERYWFLFNSIGLRNHSNQFVLARNNVSS